MVLNVVGSNPTKHPPKETRAVSFFLYPHAAAISGRHAIWVRFYKVHGGSTVKLPQQLGHFKCDLNKHTYQVS